MSYEPKEASLRVIGISAGLLVFWIAGSIGVAAWLYRGHYVTPGPPGTWLRQTSFTGGPTERTGISETWTALERDVTPHLHEYGWVDQRRRIARIPIDRAMDLIVRRGVEPVPSALTPQNSAKTMP